VGGGQEGGCGLPHGAQRVVRGRDEAHPGVLGLVLPVLHHFLCVFLCVGADGGRVGVVVAEVGLVIRMGLVHALAHGEVVPVAACGGLLATCSGVMGRDARTRLLRADCAAKRRRRHTARTRLPSRLRLTIFALLAVRAAAVVLGKRVVVLHLPVPEPKHLLHVDVPVDVVLEDQRALDVVVDDVAPRVGVRPPHTQPRLLGVILGMRRQRARLLVDVGRRHTGDHLVELDARLRGDKGHGVLAICAVGHGDVDDFLEVEGCVCGLGPGAARQMGQLARRPFCGAVGGVCGAELADSEEEEDDEGVDAQGPRREEHGRGHHGG
jgi:hypothetical protein